VIKELLKWAGTHDGAVLPKSKLGKAISYMLKLWKGLTLFETAKASAVDPRAYVTLAAKRAIEDHGAVTLPSDLT
jgi:hypothetical protein